MDIHARYTRWLEELTDDAGLCAELESIRGNEPEIQDRFYTDLSFGTAGMRGVLGAGTNRMNIYTVRRAGKGLAQYLTACGTQARGVVIAYDSRRMSAEFARQTALVLAKEGVKAYLFDALRPVPILSFAVRHLQAAAGVVITASHNPPQYNGYKVYADDGAQLSPEAADEVTKYIRALDFADCAPMNEQDALDSGMLQMIGNAEVDDAYIEMVKSLCLRRKLLLSRGSELRIVYTPLHGSGNVPVRRALREAGVTCVTVVPQQEAPDGAFPTVTAPNPEDPAAFALAIPLAREVKASVVFGTDPDCDRMGVSVLGGDGEFHTLTGNQIGCLLLYHILSSRRAAGTLPRNGAVVKSVVSTEMARAICADFGVTLFDTLTGFKFIGEKIQQFEETQEHTFLFGFEESFGYLSGTQVRDKDGVNASLLLCEAACACMEEGITLYERLQTLFQKYGYYTESVVSKVMPGQDGLERMGQVMARLRANPPRAFGDFAVVGVRDFLNGYSGGETMDCPASDVLYFELTDGAWVCMRPSGTEPKIKLYVNTRAGDAEASARDNTRLREAAEKVMQ